ncbi:PAS/PAC sensor signal transduction histidine kinase [Sphaerotilus hippei]|uniref:histidine kinase n=1 Tax=Sphaerotilus hippei TaxID=744406 RepID=A0A318H0V5_9BURK|nr:ATP-binding protein [Sphaerotilus hippei]PXW95819.1 PAS/PAC sensor signal transduction histidine kinase [Sphaerotilus hippei]
MNHLLALLKSLPVRRWRRLSLWGVLFLLIAVAEGTLLWLTWQHEHNRLQEETEQTAVTAAASVRRLLATDVQAIQQLQWVDSASTWQSLATLMLREHPEMMRIELRDEQLRPLALAGSLEHPLQFTGLPRESMLIEADAACTTARRLATPLFSRSYFVPTASGQGSEVVDLCLPYQVDSRPASLLVTVSLRHLLEHSLPQELTHRYQVMLIEADGTRLALAGAVRGAGVYRSDRLIDVAGFTQVLRLDSITETPGLLPNRNAALVAGLSLALSAVVLLLAHDVRRRSEAEQGLADALSFRKAMEDSLVTGLRARDLSGRITYVNQAFCTMVDCSAEQLVNATVPPYWPPEMIETYSRRQALRMAGDAPPREGYETVFMNRKGERFPVLIFEAPLRDSRGRQTGWMSTVLDVRAQRRIEELSRQQQEKLQAAARLATMGEMATLLSHELNQPLAAIASYATGTLNLLPEQPEDPPADAETQQMIRQAISRVAEQAERAGRIIRSVHQFVRRRERLRENVRCNELIDAILPLARLAARRSNTRLDIDLPTPPPRVNCDRTMVEQVLLNLVRNGIQAMEEDDTTLEERVLILRAQPSGDRWVELSVIDHGPGIPEAVAGQLFTPFFSTKPEGMGIGLAMCRTVVEQHGGALEFTSTREPRQTVFRFTLPAVVAPTPPSPPDP